MKPVRRRRSLLQWLLAAVLTPWQAMAADSTMRQRAVPLDTGDALLEQAITGRAGDIEMIVPAWVADGSSIQVEVMSRLPGTEAIALFAEKSAVPLLANFTFSHGAQPCIITRIKLAHSQSVEVVVKADGRYYKASRFITVTHAGAADAG